MPKTCLLLGLLSVSCLTASPHPITLVDRGKPAAVIVLSAEAAPSEKRAAGELQHFLQEMSGALLPIEAEGAPVRGTRVLVGRSGAVDALKPGIAFDSLADEGFVLKTVGRDLIIAGGRRRGTMYGVTALLEKLGCRWVAPDASRIPKLATIRVGPLDEVQKPAFEYRDVYIAEAWDKDWAARNRLNGAMARLDESTGGKIEYYPFVHSFYELIPPKQHFAQHPEYFAFVDGKRRDDKAQLCLTNKELVHVAARQVLQWIAEHPGMTISSLSQMDWGGDCQCDECRRVNAEEGAPSGTLLRFINAVAEQVEQKHPDKLIDTLAYFYNEEPPLKTRPRRNVRIRMCPIGGCQAHPYEQCPYDAYIVKNLKGWAKITNQIYIWHYNANFSHFLLPMPDFDELAADIGMYKRNGVVGLFMQGTGMPGGESGRLRAYVLSRLLWNPQADVRQAIGEFHDIYYGKAAPAMLRWYEFLHQLMRTPPAGEGQHIWCCRAPVVTDPQMEQGKRIFVDALALADNESIRRRIELAQLGARYMELQRLRQFVIHDGMYVSRGLPKLKQDLEPLFADFPKLGVTRLGEEHDIQWDHDAIAKTLRPYPVVTLENRSLRLDVVPELNGRVVHVIDRRTGRERLNQPNPVEMHYPNRSGWGVSAFTETFEAAALPLEWKIRSNDSRSLVLEAGHSTGLHFQRTLRLQGDDPVVEEELTVENRGAAAQGATLESQMDAEGGPLEDAVVRFARRNGERYERRLIRPAEQPGGVEMMQDAQSPDSSWHLDGMNGSLRLDGRFRNEQAARAVVTWSGRNQQRVSMILNSGHRTLAPNQSVELKSTYSFR